MLTQEATNIYATIHPKEKFEQAAQKIFDEIITKIDNLKGYISNNWININHKTADKSSGLSKLIALKNLNINDLYVIGDDLNDLPMIRDFKGYKITKSNPILDDYAQGEYDDIDKFITAINTKKLIKK